MTKYYEMHSVQEAPVDYKTGRNSGTIFITMWNSLSQKGVRKAKEACAKNCKGAWSVGKFPDYPSVTFRFFENDDITWWHNYLIEINHTI
jgi:hypothetical protein|tara:strand:- start:324 stop:593 length:270 start_codon:yes stop_codon:yes gene_type:complete